MIHSLFVRIQPINEVQNPDKINIKHYNNEEDDDVDEHSI